MSEKKSFLVYFDWEEPFGCMTDEELGMIFRAMLRFAKNGELPEFENKTLYMVFSFVKNAIERDMAAYEEKCRKNAENGKKGGKKKAEAELPPLNFNDLIDTLHK